MGDEIMTNGDWFGHSKFVRADIAAAREADLRAEVNTLATENADYVRELFAVSAERDRHCAEADRLRGLLDEARKGVAAIESYLAKGHDKMANNIARATLAKIGGQHD